LFPDVRSFLRYPFYTDTDHTVMITEH
jgi:hypothetical protein